LTRIKVCGLTRREDVAFCLQHNVDRVGFVFAPSPRRIGLEQLDSLLEVVPAQYPWVAVVVNAENALVEQLLQRGCAHLQFHGTEEPAWCARWRARATVMKALPLRSAADLCAAQRYEDYVDELLLDGARPGAGATFDWSWLAQKPRLPFFLAGGLGPDNVEQAVRQVRPWGVDVSSGVERGAGLKDPEKIRLFVERTRSV
jgi:phosphoribosylanthranilate isomerase